MEFTKEYIRERIGYFLLESHETHHLLEKGTIPIIVSAPHSVEQTRDGKRKYGEYQTGVLAQLLRENIDCSCIYKTKNNNDDANFDDKSDYKDELIKFIKINSINYLIDLHQLAPFRKELIDIGTGKGRNLLGRLDIAESVKRLFQNNGFSDVSIDDPFDAAYPYTISSYVSRTCNIPCIQIEINSKLLIPDDPEYAFDKIFNILCEFILYLAGANNA